MASYGETHVDVVAAVDCSNAGIDNRILHGEVNNNSSETNAGHEDENETGKPGENADRTEALLLEEMRV